jgi:hypothetical protein
LLEAPPDQRPVLLENIAKALTRRLLQDSPGIGIREVSERVAAFIKMVRARLELQRSGVLVHERHEPLGLGRGEVDVVGDAFMTGCVNCEPACAGAECGLALAKRVQRVSPCQPYRKLCIAAL